MKNQRIYSQGNKLTRINIILEGNSIFFKVKNSPELTEALKEANFEKVLKRELESVAILCYAKDIPQLSTLGYEALDVVKKLIIKDEKEKGN